jgi:hypothetical protein
VIAHGAMGCPPAGAIITRGAAVGVSGRTGEPIHVFGIATDEVHEVEVSLTDGASETVPVDNNYFTFDTRTAPKEARWIGPSGPEVYEFPAIPETH